MSFDEAQHPRGHRNNPGGFNDKSQSAPDGSVELVASWPSVGFETKTWVSKFADMGVRESAREIIYQASIPPVIADHNVVLRRDTTALAEEASAALVRFDSELGGEIAPFASLLLRSEAVSSSRIENLTASARSILTAEYGSTGKPNAVLIAANTRAMQSALELADELTPETVLAMHRALMEGDPAHTPGQWRTEPVWIGRDSFSPAGAEFVPPDSARVPELIDDVMRFAARNDLPRLAQTAITHAQFETIHPFSDGNGRTGRALIQAMLRGKGLTRNITVPVSAGLLTNAQGYHDALNKYRTGEIDEVVTLTSEASFRAIENATQLVSEVKTVQEHWRTVVKARSDSAVWRVLDLLAKQPVLTAAVVAEHLGISQTNTYPHLRSLQDAGILQAKTEFKIGLMWRSDEILKTLDDFAARTGRRGGVSR